MKLTFLGTGTSTGVPSIGCDCETCTSTDSRDKRLRVSILIEHADQTVLVDTSSDFRQQALRHELKRLDAVLITHCHADHIFGLDDIRPLNFRYGALGVYANETAWTDLPYLSIYFRAHAFWRRSAVTDTTHGYASRTVLYRRGPRGHAA